MPLCVRDARLSERLANADKINRQTSEFVDDGCCKKECMTDLPDTDVLKASYALVHFTFYINTLYLY